MMNPTDDEMTRLRAEIDRTDSGLLALLERRAELAVEIARHKQARGVPVRDPEREEAILKRLLTISKGAVSEESLRAVQSAVMRACREAQARALGGDSEQPAELSGLVNSKIETKVKST